jgi:hypothetical protein
MADDAGAASGDVAASRSSSGGDGDGRQKRPYVRKRARTVVETAAEMNQECRRKLSKGALPHPEVCMHIPPQPATIIPGCLWNLAVRRASIAPVNASVATDWSGQDGVPG